MGKGLVLNKSKTGGKAVPPVNYVFGWIITLVCSCSFSPANAQLKLDTVIYFNRPSIDYFHDVMLYLSLAKTDAGNYQIIDSKGDQLTFIELDTTFRKTAEYSITGKLEDYRLNDYVSDQFYIGQQLYLHQNSSLLVNFKTNAVKQLPITYENTVFNDTLWLYAPQDNREELYRYAGGALDTLRYEENRNMILNGFSTKHSYSVNSRYIALKRPLEYKIHLFDRQMRLVDSICLNKKGWKPYEYLPPSDKLDAKMYMYALAVQNNGHHSITNITFIQDSFLLVFYSYKEYEKDKSDYYDIWKIGEGKPVLIKEFIKDIYPGKNEIITHTNVPVNKAIRKYFMIDDKLFFFAYTDNIYPVGLTFKERERQRILFYENADPVVSLWVFSLENPEATKRNK